MVVFGLYPLVQLVRMALSEVILKQGEFRWRFVGLANFERALNDEVFGVSLRNTAIFVVVTTLATLVIGLGLALVVDRAHLLRGIGWNTSIWPAIIAPVAVSVAWWLILSQEFGLLNKVLGAVGLPAQAWLVTSSTALAAVMLVDIWHWTPLVFLIVYANLKGIDPDLIEAARVDGASERQILTRVTIPLLVPSLLVAGAIRVIMGVKVFDEMYMLTHGGPGISSMVISLYIDDVFFGATELGYGATLGLTVVAAVLVVLGVGWLSRRSLRSVRSVRHRARP